MRVTDLLLSSPSGQAWLPLADAVLKATLLLAAAGLASFVLRRGSAAARHLVWMLALVSALALPVLSIALPRWQLPIVTLTSTTPAIAAAIDGPAVDQPAPPAIAHSTSHHTAAVPGSPAAPIDAPRASFTLPAVSWAVAVFLLWALGAAAIAGRLVVGLLAVQWMSRRTERVTDARWLGLARRLAAELGVSPRIIFLRSGRAVMPMAWGILRPAVLMPADADEWPAERLRIVLLHELAHVKRRDCLTHMLAQIACALYWFNPLAWIAARHVRTERERACDDLVLAAGTRGADYADQLLAIARVMRSGRFPAVLAGATLAMAHRSQLEGRLMAILDPSVPRSGVTRMRTAVAATVFACALMPLASLQPWTFAAELPAANATPDVTAQAPVTQPPVAAAPEAAAQSAVESQVQSAAQSRAQGSLQTAVQSGVESAVATVRPQIVGMAGSLLGNADQRQNVVSNINSIVNTTVNTNVNTKVNTNVNRHGGGDDQGKPADPRMVAALTAALKDTDKDVRETALQALVQMHDPSVYEPLVQALADASPGVREQAAFGLGQLRDRRAVEPLTAALKDQSGDVREQAAFALGQLRDRSAVPALTAAIKDADDDVREQAVFALGQIRDPASYEGLAAATHDAKPDVREQAVFALGQLRDRRALEPLVSALKDANADVREQAAFGLGQIRDRGAVEALVIALKDAAADVREQAAFALGQIRDPRAIDGLTTALKDTSASVRQQAAFALGQLAR